MTGAIRRARHYARLLARLPADERRLRAARVLERWLRRDPRVRALGLMPDEPRWPRFRAALRVPLDALAAGLRAPHPRRGPLHVDLAPRAAFIARERAEVARSRLDDARHVLDDIVDLLGAGPSRPVRQDGGPDWHRDWVSGATWPPATWFADVITVRGDGSDVKLPWELSRAQHLLALGEAWHLAPLLVADAAESSTLRARCAAGWARRVDDWITQNPRGLGVNWACTMDVGLRALAWCAGLSLLREAPELDDAFLRRVARSLWVHGRHIRANLEIGADGLTSNHYLSDVVGLCAIGCFLHELREAAGWRAFGFAALAREMDAQVLPDGMDFERSLPYHRLVAELFLVGTLLARGAEHTLPRAFDEKLGAMLEVTRHALRPDGTVPQWGDNDDGRALPLGGAAAGGMHDHRHLLALGGALLRRAAWRAAAGSEDLQAAWLVGPPPAARPAANAAAAAAPRSHAFTASGLYVMRRGAVHVLVGCGPVGTRGVGNHSHNDLCAPVIWAGGREWITDPGTGTYTRDPLLRNRLRGTAAHATVQLGTREQNPLGPRLEDLFVLREAARPRVLDWTTSDEDGDRLVAEHEGFSGPEGRWVHRRSFALAADGRSLVIEDALAGPESAPDDVGPVTVRLPLAPGVGAEIEGDAAALRDGTQRATLTWRAPEGTIAALESAPYSPSYGRTVEALVLVLRVPLARTVTLSCVFTAPED